MSLRNSLDVGDSVLASSARYWRGTMAWPAARQPENTLELYEFEGCPFCRLVREALTELDLDAMVYPCPKGGQRYRPRVSEMGGKALFPYLVDPNTGVSMYESSDIIDYLYETYGGRKAPSHLLRPLEVATSSLTSGIRGAAGIKVRPAKAPESPLELYSFESSPYSRRVRELLTELEIPYLLRNTGKAMAKDLGPPQLRAKLFPDLPVKGRNRLALLERAGKVQVPYLIDPNTGTEMFESDDILEYLTKTYST